MRRIDRDLLQGEDRFALAPPTGVSPYDDTSSTEELASLDGGEVRADATAATSPKDVATTGGSVRGVVTDAKSGAIVAGVLVVATGPGPNDVHSEITGDDGSYTVDGLATGAYQLNFYYADQTTETKNIHVTEGRTIPPLPMRISTAGGETISINGNPRRRSTPPARPRASRSTSTTSRTRRCRDASFESALGQAAGSQSDGLGTSFSGATSNESVNYVTESSSSSSRPTPPPPIRQGDAKLVAIAQQILAAKKDVVIESHGATAAEVGKRAEAVRNKLVDEGVPAKRIHVTPKVGPGESNRLRVLAVAAGAKPEVTAPPAMLSRDASETPVGESHFMAERPMDVANRLECDDRDGPRRDHRGRRLSLRSDLRSR